VIPFIAGGHAEVVRMLLEAGADANVKQSGLVTPLHLAAKGIYCFFRISLFYMYFKCHILPLFLRHEIFVLKKITKIYKYLVIF
jgi:hypothetical protein